jgi:alkylated DNA nucleotide flippase Atl1
MLEKIRATIRKIPRGKVATYGDVARAAGFPGAARQVVWALRRAGPGLPWHRVIGAGGRIRLPGEAGFEQRTRLAAKVYGSSASGSTWRSSPSNFEVVARAGLDGISRIC